MKLVSAIPVTLLSPKEVFQRIAITKTGSSEVSDKSNPMVCGLSQLRADEIMPAPR